MKTKLQCQNGVDLQMFRRNNKNEETYKEYTKIQLWDPNDSWDQTNVSIIYVNNLT